MKRLLRTFYIVFFLFVSSCNNDAKRKIETIIFRNDTISGSNLTGFGYDILVDGKRYIHQPHIPAISGSAGFVTEEDAHKTAAFAAAKLNAGNKLPVISVQELDSLGIKY